MGTILVVSAPASAAGEVSLAQGRFISGSALGIDLDTLLSVDPAQAANTGSPAQVTDTHPLTVTALNGVPDRRSPRRPGTIATYHNVCAGALAQSRLRRTR